MFSYDIGHDLCRDINLMNQKVYTSTYIYIFKFTAICGIYMFIWVCTAYIWHIFLYVIINFVDQVCFELDGYKLMNRIWFFVLVHVYIYIYIIVYVCLCPVYILAYVCVG